MEKVSLNAHFLYPIYNTLIFFKITTEFYYSTSLSGIILFEMSYRPLDTSMERIKILSKLRMKEITFPEDFIDKKNEKQLYLVRYVR